ncbi:hypothetical protein SAY86_022647 [Trapa natans]|uniref:Uncharacterized protein n=1 Tax=Trapa natans TaxID=22666 RepID=A0AAN7R768_TRANT|nr:hypothetical protein SAY86_022647 [Trapa natans]
MISLLSMASSSIMSTPARLCSTYSLTRRSVCTQSLHSSSWSPSIACPRTSKSLLPIRLPQPGLIRFSPWSGLKPFATSVALSSRRSPSFRPNQLAKSKQNIVLFFIFMYDIVFDDAEWSKRRQRRMVVHASLFGVGAPEALVIGVVALLVFGPKGLAEVARNLGKTLREFQPTIRELQEVSREFKSTLEREIGLDEIQGQNAYKPTQAETTSFPPTIASDEQPPQTVVDPNGVSSSDRAYSSEDYLKITEEQLKLSATEQPQPQNLQTELPGEIQSEEADPQVEETVAMPPPPKSENGT